MDSDQTAEGAEMKTAMTLSSRIASGLPLCDLCDLCDLCG